MSTQCRAVCTACDDVIELHARDITLQSCVNDESRTFYSFECPVCATHNERPLPDPDFVDALIAAGAVLVLWSVPLEVLEPHTGSALTVDDLIDFALELDIVDAHIAAELLHQ